MKIWILKFAQELSQSNIFCRLDLWDVNIGDDLHEFMEKGIEEADFVVCIFTPKYLQKSKKIQTGVKLEMNIISNVYFSTLGKQILPILRKGDVYTAIPTKFHSFKYIDLKNDTLFKHNIQVLINRIKGRSHYKRPSLSLY